MEQLIQEAIKQNALLKKTSFPWKADEPHPQAFHTFDPSTTEWRPQRAPSTPSAASSITKLALYSWNIDFMLPSPTERMTSALASLGALIASQPPPDTAVVIFLQECLVSDLAVIARTGWVRERFHITDVDDGEWTSGQYGTTVLVDRRLGVRACFRVHFAQTRMERDALFVDVAFGGGDEGRVVRLCNAHLESLALEPAFRPPQMGLIAGYMRGGGEEKEEAKDYELRGAVVAGDFNAIQEEDKTLHEVNGLRDAYLEMHPGGEGKEEGFTWGQQAATVLRERFGLSRMDKVFFCGEGLVLRRFGRFGEDVVVEEAEVARGIVELGFERAWVTDHLGVVAEFDVR